MTCDKINYSCYICLCEEWRWSICAYMCMFMILVTKKNLPFDFRLSSDVTCIHTQISTQGTNKSNKENNRKKKKVGNVKFSRSRSGSWRDLDDDNVGVNSVCVCVCVFMWDKLTNQPMKTTKQWRKHTQTKLVVVM